MLSYSRNQYFECESFLFIPGKARKPPRINGIKARKGRAVSEIGSPLKVWLINIRSQNV